MVIPGEVKLMATEDIGKSNRLSLFSHLPGNIDMKRE